MFCRQLYAKNCLGGASHTFTVTGVSGLDLTIPLDQASGALTAAPGLTHSSGNSTTTVADEILIGLAATVESLTVTNDPDFIERFDRITGSAAEGMKTSTRLVTGTEANAFIVTTPSSVRGISMVASYKIASVGVGTNTDIIPPTAIRHGAIV